MENFESKIVNEFVKRIKKASMDIDYDTPFFACLDNAIAGAAGDENASIMGVSKAFGQNTAISKNLEKAYFEKASIGTIEAMLSVVADELESGKGVLLHLNGSSEYALHSANEILLYKPEHTV